MSRADFTFRAAVSADAEALAVFWRDRFRETFAHLYPPADLARFEASAYVPAQIAAEIASPDFSHTLAFLQDRLVGAMKGGAVSLPVANTSGLWELHRLYLTPDTHGSGLADALMGAAREAAVAAGNSAMVLGVYCDNERAKRFYTRHGFRQIGSYHFVVGDTLDDEWIMQAPL